MGDIVQVQNNKPIPADLLILSSSEGKGSCYVETKNLDGETNLKLKSAHKEVAKHINNEQDLANLKGMIGCERPNNNIHKFDAYIELNGEKISLSSDNIALRGSYLRNTDRIYGMAVFTGHDTKIMQNSAKASYKFSELEKNTNLCIIVILSLQFILSLIASLTGTGIASNTYTSLNWVAGTNKTDRAGVPGLTAQLIGTWILLLTNFVPISLIVQLELVKFWQAMFMTYDHLMYDDRSTDDPNDEDMPMRA